MTLEDFRNINWHRGNVAMLENGKEYFVKGIKGHGRYILLYSLEYDKCFVADHNIVVSRTSDYEEPEEVYLEQKRQKQAEAKAKREAERQEYLREKVERKQKNIEAHELAHQEALARKEAKKQTVTERKKMESKAIETPKPVAKPETPVVTAVEQLKRKRQRIRISHTEKVMIK